MQNSNKNQVSNNIKSSGDTHSDKSFGVARSPENTFQQIICGDDDKPSAAFSYVIHGDVEGLFRSVHQLCQVRCRRADYREYNADSGKNQKCCSDMFFIFLTSYSEKKPDKTTPNAATLSGMMSCPPNQR